jgi:hypothetical protein
MDVHNEPMREFQKQLRQLQRRVTFLLGIVAVTGLGLLFSVLHPSLPAAVGAPAQNIVTADVIRSQRLEIIEDGKVRAVLGNGEFSVPLLLGESKQAITSGLILFDSKGKPRGVVGMMGDYPAMHLTNENRDSLSLTSEYGGCAIAISSDVQLVEPDSRKKRREVKAASSGTYDSAGIWVNYGIDAKAGISVLRDDVQPRIEVQDSAKKTLFKVP